MNQCVKESECTCRTPKAPKSCTPEGDRGCLWRLFFRRSSSRKNASHAVVALVAGVLDHRAFRTIHRNLNTPGLRERGWVVHSELIENRVRATTGEPLDQVHVLVATAEISFVGE